MADLRCGLIDVFANAPLTGNPLAVVEDADALDDETMRRIAREFNQAETTFLVRSSRGADWKLRSFTASGVEVGGAGHNALGAWLWLGYRGKLGDLQVPKTFQQEVGAEILPITLQERGGRIHGCMKQAALRLFPPLSDLEPLAQALGLGRLDILSTPAPRPADTGTSHLMVRVRNLETVDRAEPSAKDLLRVLNLAKAEGCYIYALDPERPGSAYARFFNPTIGLWEDSATGTAAGPLCAYLGTEGLLANNELVIEQGRRMGRPSFLHVRLSPDAEISGTGVIVLHGTLHPGG